MSGVQDKKLITALKYAKVTALVLALSSTGVLIQGSNWVYADDTPATSEGGNENDSSAGGSDGATADQDSTSTADANSDPNGDASASGTGSGSAGGTGTSGGKTAGAEVQTDTVANADKDGAKYSADATANANVGKSSDKTDVTAIAKAVFGGGNNMAYAETQKNEKTFTKSKSVLGVEATTYCAGGCDREESNVSGKKTFALSVKDDHMSYTLTTRNKSYAESGALKSFTRKDARRGGSAFVSAWAKATGFDAKSHATAEAKSYSGRSSDGGVTHNEWMKNVVKQQQKWAKERRKRMKPFAWANSKSYAKACVGTGCRPPVRGFANLGGECEWRYRNRDGQFLFPPVCIYPDVDQDPNN